MSGERDPVLGKEVLPRVCGRRLGPLTEDRECGRPAVRHVIWDPETMENGYSCEEHATEAVRDFDAYASHPLGDCCGMPGALFWWPDNECRYDEGGLPVAERERVEVPV